MKRAILLLGLAALAGCTTVQVNTIQFEESSRKTDPAKIKVYHTMKAIPRPYAVVAKYNVHIITPSNIMKAMADLRAKAAQQGCDALLSESVLASRITVWGLFTLFIPIQQAEAYLTFTGLRFTDGREE